MDIERVGTGAGAHADVGESLNGGLGGGGGSLRRKRRDREEEEEEELTSRQAKPPHKRHAPLVTSAAGDGGAGGRGGSVFLPIMAEAGVAVERATHDVGPNGEAVVYDAEGRHYRALGDDLLVNVARFDQITFCGLKEGFVESVETGNFERRAMGSSIDLWRYSDTAGLFLAMSLFFEAQSADQYHALRATLIPSAFQ